MYNKLNIYHAAYFIHGYSVGSDHSLEQLKLSIGSEYKKKPTLKYNASHLKGKTSNKLRMR